MERILMLAYHYPPIGGAAVMRNARLARLLPECGYEPVVLTGPGGHEAYRWTPRDDTFVDGGSAWPSVHRVQGPEPARDRVWRNRAARWGRTPTPWERWWRRGVLANALAVGRDAALVHASVAPYETARSAVEVAAALGKPLVLDFEDPWAFDEMLVYPTAAHRALDRRAMRRTVNAADVVVMNTREAARRVTAGFPELKLRRVACVPNGFDERDFLGDPPARADHAFRIIHTGSFHTDLGLRQRAASPVRRRLGGSVDGVDFLTRSPRYLLQALEQLVRDRPELAASIELHLAGVLTEEDVRTVRHSPLVRIHGFLDHVETIKLIRSADLLFLPMHDIPVGRRIGIVPCKTYEYAASGLPILAAVPDGDARELLVRLGTANVCRPSDVNAMKTAIADTHARWAAGVAAPIANPAAQRPYEFGRVAAELAALYDGLLGVGRPSALACPAVPA